MEPSDVLRDRATAAAAPEPRFLDGAAVDQLAGMVLSLGMEVAVLSARVAELEGRAQPDGALDDLIDRLFANLVPRTSHQRPLVAERVVTRRTP